MAYSIVNVSTAKHKQPVLGAKAQNLIELINNNYPVPETIILPSATSQQLNDTLLSTITTTLTAPYIIRSSTSSEDRPNQSFAGLSGSIPDIHGPDNLKKALLKLATTNQPVKIAGYANENPIKNNSATTLIVQEYKKPRQSGVIFTENPENSQQMIIEYSDQAHGVTNATVSPQRIRLERNNPRISDTEPNFLKQLVSLALRIEKLFKAPQDIEWVYDGGLWIVQSRPITTHASCIQAEIFRLQEQFGEYAPRLSAQQFTESLGSATPITQSLFMQFFSENGSWGKFLKQYRIPHRNYMVKTYIPNVFGRLYMNKDEEQRILFQNANYQHQSSFAAIPTLLQTLQHPLISLGRVLAITRLRIGTYYHYRRFDRAPSLNPTATKASIESLEVTRTRLVNETVPRLFQASAFQDHCLQILRKRLYNHVDNLTWEKLLRPAHPGFVSGVLQQASNEAALIEQIGHRGPQEFELAEPRWAEKPAELLAMYNHNDSLGNQPFDEILTLRESIIKRFASAWDQQTIETHFLLYDYYFTCREQAHDIWIRDLTRMRRVLLELDSLASLNGLIWYADLQEILDFYPALDIENLRKGRDRHQELTTVSLPTEIDGSTWSSLVFSPLPPLASSNSYAVQRLVGGITSGMTGTVEDLKAGKPVLILITPSLDPSLVVYFHKLGGIITETGGLLSHGTILAREFGIPTVSLLNATNVIPPNTYVIVNANLEQIQIDDPGKK